MNKLNLSQPHQISLKDLFAKDPRRAVRFSLEAAGLFLDYSKNPITEESLFQWAQRTKAHHLKEKIQSLFSGGLINPTEHRPALHTALRDLHTQSPLIVNGKDVRPMIAQQLAKMEQLVHAVYAGQLTGYTQKPITDILNLGIGGSDLGPKLVTRALSPYHLGKVRCHFVANIDGYALSSVLPSLCPENTLVIVSSKSFTTTETLTNAETVKAWFKAYAGNISFDHQFWAVTSQPKKALAWGILPNQIFEIGEFIGGRYSLWSPIGLPIALAIGMRNFKALLEGAYQMDQHFLTAPVEKNMPVILGSLAFDAIRAGHAQSHAVIPYLEQLDLLPAYLQQLDMESNGKSITTDGQTVHGPTAPILWGGVGTQGQHAFHQLLHQGTLNVPVDFILARDSHCPVGEHNAILYANCLAQAKALMEGKTLEEAKTELRSQGLSESEIERQAPHRVIAGNKSSNLIWMDQLSPQTLGALIALYEHRTFVQGVLFNINPFDQWGVELGKQLCGPILSKLRHHTQRHFDSSTEQLIQKFNHRRPWVILDRDGVINVDRVDFVKTPEEWIRIPGSLEAIAKLNKAGIIVTIASNQSGVSRGVFTHADVEKVHEVFLKALKEVGGHIDALLYCPHAPVDHCHCRKPAPGLLFDLAEKVQRPLSEAVFIGDNYRDLEAGFRAGCRNILVKTGKGEDILKKHPALPTRGVPVYKDLAEFVDDLLSGAWQ